MSWLRSWYAACTDGRITNMTDRTVTTAAWTSRMRDGMPARFVRWNQRGR